MNGLELLVFNFISTLGLSIWVVNLLMIVYKGLKIIAIIIVTVYLIMLLKQVLHTVLKRTNRFKIDSLEINSTLKTVEEIIGQIIKYTLWIITVIIILSELGIDVLPLLAGVGVIGLALAFGVQSLVQDVISGFFMLVEGQFNKGDLITIGDFTGTVSSLSLRTTTLTSWKNEVKTFNNSEIKTMINRSKLDSVGVIDIHIAYSENIIEVTELVNETLSKIPLEEPLKEQPKLVGVTELSRDYMNLRVVFKSLVGTHYGLEREYRKILLDMLFKNNISMVPHEVRINKD
jgi:small-conductance mechanosensitive channel